MSLKKETTSYKYKVCLYCQKDTDLIACPNKCAYYCISHINETIDGKKTVEPCRMCSYRFYKDDKFINSNVEFENVLNNNILNE